MRRRLLPTIGSIVLIALGTGCAGRTLADRSGPWHLRGAVVSTAPTSVTLRHKSGRIVTLALDERTSYVQGVNPSAASALTPGTRVRVDVVPYATGDRASRVTIF